MTYLTILNTLAIVYLLITRSSKYYFEFSKDKTSRARKLLGYRISLWKRLSRSCSQRKYSIYFPVRRRLHTETLEDVEWVKEDTINKNYNLRARFSWLSTQEEADRFKKYYRVVDEQIVDNLVSNFTPKL